MHFHRNAKKQNQPTKSFAKHTAALKPAGASAGASPSPRHQHAPRGRSRPPSPWQPGLLGAARAGPGRSAPPSPLGSPSPALHPSYHCCYRYNFSPHRFAKSNFSKQEQLKYLSLSFLHTDLQKAQTCLVYGQTRKFKKSVQIC